MTVISTWSYVISAAVGDSRRAICGSPKRRFVDSKRQRGALKVGRWAFATR
jgi:hypothetical protein